MATKMARHAGFDNCKNVFIFFVVLIHLCNYDLIKWSETNAGWSPAMDNFMESYTRWHEKLSVPGFVFLSGFFGKGFLHTAEAGKKAEKRWEKTISVLLVGAALVQAVDFVVGYVGAGLVTGEWNKPPLWFPLWEKLETWYLIALFLWRLSTPLISRLRYPILSSFLVTFVCLHIQFEGPMDMRMRVLHYLPYYVTGLYFDEKLLNAIPRPRLVGCLGVVVTMLVCLQVDAKYLGHAYFVPSWEVFPHVVFFWQYLLCGSEILSVILIFRSVAFPLFPYGHSNSTLAIYEWHWPIVGMITWGHLPFSSVNMPGMSNPSLFLYMATHVSPFWTLVFTHIMAYGLCVALGSTLVWRLVRHISDPDCGFIFVSGTSDTNHDMKEKKRLQKLQRDEESQAPDAPAACWSELADMTRALKDFQ